MSAATLNTLDVCNMALGFIGTRTIDDLNEGSVEAIQCSLYWNRARRAVLCDYPRGHPWSFALQRKTLVTASTNITTEYRDWKYCYQWPDDALRICAVHGVGRERVDRSVPFLVRNIRTTSNNTTTATQVIFCDLENAQAEYIIDIQEGDACDPLFYQLLIRKLACYLAVPLLKNNQNKVQEIEQLYDVAFQKANEQAIRGPVTWEVARRAVLCEYPKDHPWPFALKRIPLTPVTQPPEKYAGDWKFCYQWPEDALRVCAVHAPGVGREGRVVPYAVRNIEHEVYYGSSEQVILCDVENVQAECIVDVVDEQVHDPLFTQLVTYKLACLSANAVPDNGENAAQAENIYNAALQRANDRVVQENLKGVARRAVLCEYPKDHPWPFALKRIPLTPVTQPPEKYAGDWKFCYQWPEDALRVCAVHAPGVGREGRVVPYAVRNIEHEVYYGSSEQVILCDVENVQAECIVDVVDEQVHDPLFTQLVTYKLACLSANAVPDNGENAAQAENIYNAALQRANDRVVQENLKGVARRAVLCEYPKDHPWPFSLRYIKLEPELARDRILLAKHGIIYGGGWGYCYKWPKEALQIRSVHATIEREEGSVPFVTRNIFGESHLGSTKQIILCDVPDAWAECIVDVVDEEVHDPLFTQLVTYKMACYSTAQANDNGESATRAEALYNAALQKATDRVIQNDLHEDLRRMDEERRYADATDDWLMSRT